MMQRFILLIAICLAAVSADVAHTSTKITSAHQQQQRRELSSFSFTNIWSNFLNHICGPHDNDKCHGIIHNPCCHVHHHSSSHSSSSSSGGGSSSSSSSSSGGSSGGGGSDDWGGDDHTDDWGGDDHTDDWGGDDYEATEHWDDGKYLLSFLVCLNEVIILIGINLTLLFLSILHPN